MTNLKAFLSWPSDHPTRAGALAGWFQQGCGMLVAIMLIPVVTRVLSPNEAGIWFAFQGLVTMMGLMDLGFGFAISRQAAFTFGATKSTVTRDDFIHLEHGWPGLAQLLRLTRALYLWLAAATAVLGLVAFEIFSRFGNLIPVGTPGVRWCWYAMTIASVLLILTAGQSAFLSGLGVLYQTRFLAGLYQLVAGSGAALAAWQGFGLSVMGASFAMSALFYFGAVKIVRLAHTKHLSSSKIDPPSSGSLWRLAKAAIPVGIINLFGSMIYTIQPVLLGMLLGPKDIPAIYFALKVGVSLNGLAMQFHGATLPIFTRLVGSEDLQKTRQYLAKSIRLTWAAQLVGVVAFVILVPNTCQFFLSSNQFEWSPFIWILAIDFLLMGIFVPMGQFVLASGRNPFLLQVVLSGLSSLVLSWFLIQIVGPIGLPVATLLSNLVFHERAYLRAFILRWPGMYRMIFTNSNR